MTELRSLALDTAADQADLLHRLREAAPAAAPRPVLACRWRIDPVTGRPVAEWVAEPAGR